MAHTPGPWVVVLHEPTDEDLIYAASDEKRERCIGTVAPWGDEAPHNARLVAAAPDLLQTLRAWKEAVDAGNVTFAQGATGPFAKLCHDTLAAIARAEALEVTA